MSTAIYIPHGNRFLSDGSFLRLCRRCTKVVERDLKARYLSMTLARSLELGGVCL